MTAPGRCPQKRPAVRISLCASHRGRGYDGLYYVKSVTSTLKRGEFKQNLSLVRDGLISLTPTVPT
jgi:hypothetical protein